MNGSIAFPILTFLVGGILGALATIRVVRKEYERRIDQLTYENNYLSEKVDQAADKNGKLIDQMESIVSERVESTVQSMQEDGTNFVELSKKYRDPDFDAHFAQRVGPEDDPPLRDPFEISESDYDGICGEMSTEELRFYQLDGTLTDMDDVVLEDPYAAIGADLFNMLTETEKDLVYIQNDAHGLLYEITVEHGMSYHHDILGEGEFD